MSNLDLKLTFAFLQWEVGEFKNTLKEIRPLLIGGSDSLETRWEMYLLIRPFLETDGSYMDFKTLNDIHEISWYDDFYLERGETQKLDSDFIDRATEKFLLNEEQVNALKEEILEVASKQGYGAFENDW